MSHQEEIRFERALGEILAPPADTPAPFDLLPRILAIPERTRPRLPLRRSAGLAAAAGLLLLAWIGVSSPDRTSSSSHAIAPPVTVASRVLAAITSPEALSDETVAELGKTALTHLHRLATGENGQTARVALEWIGRIANSRSLPVLIEAVDLPDREKEASQALAAIGPRALPALVLLLDRPQLLDTTLDAIEAIGGLRAVNALALAVVTSRDPEIRRRLLHSLAVIDGREGTRRLLAFLGDEALGKPTLDALTEHRDSLVPHLVELAEKQTDAGPALRALVLLAPPEAVPALRRLLDDRTRRPLAARALARIDTTEAVDALLSRPSDPAILAAARFGGPGLEDAVLARLPEAPSGEQPHLIDILAEAGGDRSVPTLCRLASRPAVGPAAVDALAGIGTTAAIRTLAALGRIPRLRRAVIQALGTTTDADAVPALLRIGLEERGVRREVCRALSGIPSARAVEGILLLEKEGGIGQEARRALARMDGRLVRSALEGLIDSKLEPEAKRALANLGLSAGPPRVVSLL